MSDTEHWLDRLAIRYTRRQALKAGALGGAALTLPLIRVPTARATGTDACYKGCNWTAHHNSSNSYSACVAGATGSAVVRTAYVLISIPLFVGSFGQQVRETNRCADMSIMQLKAGQYDCLQPTCNGFDPKTHGGPCSSCGGAYCCPNSSVDEGYSCCSECCSKTGQGCGSGVTECGH
jgi:hypothetical protein